MEEEAVKDLVKNSIDNYFLEKEKVKQENEKKILEAKHIEFHSQSVNAWYMSALEKDKSILTLSVAGIGFLITLLMNEEINSYIIFILFCSSILSFLISIIFIIYIFELNKKYLTGILKNDNSNKIKIKTKDKIAVISFVFGILFSIIIGISVALSKLNDDKLKLENNNPSYKIEKKLNKGKENEWRKKYSYRKCSF